MGSRLSLLPFLLLTVSAIEPCGAWPQLPAASEIPQSQLIDPQEREHYAGVRSVVDWSPSELVKALPELKGLATAQSQEELATLLRKVGENVEAFFRDFPSTTSVEEIRQERFLPGKLDPESLEQTTPLPESQEQTFHYLMLAGPENRPMSGLQEYRTDNKGNRVNVRGMAKVPSILTSGFVSSAIYFHPVHQNGSAFRYLGRQHIDKRETYVVAFAQRPVTTRLVGWVANGEKTAAVLLQGVAWIDPTTYQIIRMRTDLLAPRPDVHLERQSTEIRFAEVHLKTLPGAFWLPGEVVVTVSIFGETYRNTHRYSHFRLFKVETQETPEAKQPTPGEPQKPE
jgi:hypothetical protein